MRRTSVAGLGTEAPVLVAEAAGRAEYALGVATDVPVVPEGMVWVGSDPASSATGEDAFCLGRCEVTNWEYQAYLAATGASRLPADWVNGTYPAGQAWHPVTGVSLADALAYCAWFGATHGCDATLPTTAQMLRAALGASLALPVARTSPFTRPVGEDAADCSVYGCYDLLGNAREWTLDGAIIGRAGGRIGGFRVACPVPLAVEGGEIARPAIADVTAIVNTTPTTPAPNPLDPNPPLDPVGLPRITVQPVSQTVAGGSSPSFTVTASGAQPFTFRWAIEQVSFGGPQSVLPPGSFQIVTTGATTKLTVPNATSAANGRYSVTVTNANGSATSLGADLTVIDGGLLPTITSQPAGQTVDAGGTATFSVVAGGFPAPTCQWNLNGVALAGATGASLSVTNAQAANAGTYTVTVSNALGSATSSAATLTVNGKAAGTGTTGGSGGGGGGAPSVWFCLVLAALGLRRLRNGSSATAARS